VALSEDQHPVGEFCSHGADESFGVAVGLWAPGRDLQDRDAGVGDNGVEGCGELAGAVADEESELGCAITEIADQVAGLLSGPGSVGVGGGAEDVDVAGVDLDHEEHINPLQSDGAIDVEEVAGQHRRCLGAQELPPRGPV